MGATAQRWQAAIKDPTFRIHSIVTALLLVPIAVGFSSLVGYIEQRPGVELNDPFLTLLPIVNLTLPIFLVVYAAIGSAIVGEIRNDPRRLMFLFQLWAATTLIRGVVMFVTPLDDPEGAIILVDPITTFFFRATTAPTKDLFFSGHTSTLFILFVGTRNPLRRRLYLLGTIWMGFAVLIQRVHYTVDVIAAPVFVFAMYRLLLQIPGSLGLPASDADSQTP